MSKLSEIKNGQKFEGELVVLEVSERKTKASKPYLAVVLSDGEQRINGNYWDWVPTSEPVVTNTVYNVKAMVSEWQGTLQLNILDLSISTDGNLYDFMPRSSTDIDRVYEAATQVAYSIPDLQLRYLTAKLLRDLEGKWRTIPGAKSVHHAYVAGTLIHSLSVAKIARAIASNIPEANESLVIAGALLHDLGKLYTYGMNGVVIDYTDEGQLFEHAFIGAEFVGNFAEDTDIDDKKLALLRHIILSHHKKLEYGAVVTPRCLEAYIVHYADAIDATAEQLREASKNSPNSIWLNKIWTLDNMQHLNPSYINNKVFADETQEKETV